MKEFPQKSDKKTSDGELFNALSTARTDRIKKPADGGFDPRTNRNMYLENLGPVPRTERAIGLYTNDVSILPITKYALFLNKYSVKNVFLLRKVAGSCFIFIKEMIDFSAFKMFIMIKFLEMKEI